VIDGDVRLAYAPVTLDAAGNGVRFHLARANALAALQDGAKVTLSFLAADAYISPDWYKLPSSVPTWNYIAVEGEGMVRRLSQEELLQLVTDTSTQEEAKLLPKKPWTLDKLPEGKTDMLLNAITGLSVSFDRLEGKFKLSQNKVDDMPNVIAALEQRGDADSLAIAAAMRKHLPV
jgi:transcriptional regulator